MESKDEPKSLNRYSRLSQHLFQDIKNVLHSIIKNSVIKFICIFPTHSFARITVQFRMKKCISQQQRTAIEKQFIAFS